ncbi:MAG: cupin domain-containing protein [Coprobacillaceae bacterium]
MFNIVDIKEKFTLVTEYYTPKRIASLNGTAIKIAKFKGPFTWHTHTDSDEIFWVIQGELKILLKGEKEEAITLQENQMFSVPKGIEHKPMAENEAWIVLLEPDDMLNTGNVDNEFTVRNIEKI